MSVSQRKEKSVFIEISFLFALKYNPFHNNLNCCNLANSTENFFPLNEKFLFLFPLFIPEVNEILPQREDHKHDYSFARWWMLFRVSLHVRIFRLFSSFYCFFFVKSWCKLKEKNTTGEKLVFSASFISPSLTKQLDTHTQK